MLIGFVVAPRWRWSVFWAGHCLGLLLYLFLFQDVLSFLRVFCCHILCILPWVPQGMVPPLLRGVSWHFLHPQELFILNHPPCIFFSPLLLTNAESFTWMASSYLPRSLGIVHWKLGFPVTLPYLDCPNTKIRNPYFCPVLTISSVFLIFATLLVSSDSTIKYNLYTWGYLPKRYPNIAKKWCLGFIGCTYLEYFMSGHKWSDITVYFANGDYWPAGSMPSFYIKTRQYTLTNGNFWLAGHVDRFLW